MTIAMRFARTVTAGAIAAGMFGANAWAQVAQPPIRILNPANPNPTPGDVRMNQFEDVAGTSWRVFAVDSLPEW